MSRLLAPLKNEVTWLHKNAISLREDLQYHVKIAECVCDSKNPLGACLKCDLAEVLATADTIFYRSKQILDEIA